MVAETASGHESAAAKIRFICCASAFAVERIVPGNHWNQMHGPAGYNTEIGGFPGGTLSGSGNRSA